MKVVLINPPLSTEEIYGKYSDLAHSAPPVGLCSLAAYLLKHGYKVRIIDAAVSELSVEGVTRNILDDPVDLVGIYSNTASFHAAAGLASMIKSAKKDQKIVVGGPHISFLPEESLGSVPFDYGVVGEGEKTLLELARHIEGGSGDLSSIDGLAFRSQDGGVTVNKPRERIDDLDELPFPAVHLLPPLSKYKPYLLQYRRLPYMAITSARGCPYECTFCKTPFGRAVRFHGAPYVVDYIEFLSRNYGVREIFFNDDTFTFKESRVFEICELMRKKGLDITWYANARVDIKDKNIFKEMKQAGCWLIALGVESADAGILELLKKNISLDEVSSTSRAAMKAGLILKTFFIIGNPGETPDSIEKTIRFAAALKSHFPVFSLMTPFPGTELWETAARYGTFDRSSYRKLVISSSDPVFIPHGLSKEILLKKQKEAFRRLYLEPGMLKRQLFSITSFEDLKKLMKAFFAYLKVQSN